MQIAALCNFTVCFEIAFVFLLLHSPSLIAPAQGTILVAVKGEGTNSDVL